MDNDATFLAPEPEVAEPAVVAESSSSEPPAGSEPAEPIEGAEPVELQADLAAEPQADDVARPEDELDLLPSAADEPLTVKALNDKLGKNPEFKTALDKDPGLRNLLYATARQAEQSKQFKEIFQTPAMAKTALELANKHIEFENTVSGGKPEQVLDGLYGMTAMRDANGEIDYNQPNPQYAAAITHYREGNLWPHVASLVERIPAEGIRIGSELVKAEDLRDALAIVATALGDKVDLKSPYAGSAASAPKDNKLDPETQGRLDRLDQLEQKDRDASARQAEEYNTSIRTGIGESVTTAAKGYLDNLIKSRPNAAITDYIKSTIIEKAVAEVYELAKNDQAYKAHINFLFKSSKKDEEGRKKIVAEATKYAKERLPRVIANHISQASKGVIAGQQQKLDKITKQKERTEVQGNGGVASPSRLDPAKRVEEFIKTNKRKPTDLEILNL